MGEKEDLTLDNFGTGLLCGLIMRHAPVSGWRLRTTYAHAAAAAVYEYLEQLNRFNLRFHIYLDPIYGKSSDWDNQVDRLKLQRWLSQSMPDGEYTLRVSERDLLVWLDLGVGSRLPGDRNLWGECADMFARTYSQLQVPAR